MIKLALREWHQTHAQNLTAKIQSLKDKITSLDLKGESDVLIDEEVEDLHGFTEDLFSLSRMNFSICWQQSRMKWLWEGDANSKFFHGIRNAIPFFLVNCVMIKGVDNVRNAVFSHFSTHYKSVNVERPSMGNVQFRTLSYREGASLIRPFSVEELKAAVWDYDSYKCLGPDGISLGFIKKKLGYFEG